MKRLVLVSFFCLLTIASAPAQGLVNFFNTASGLISVPMGTGTVVPSGAAGSYYFGLFTAPSGTTDPALFTFSGLYATNQAAAGRFSGGASISVPGWAAGATKAFLVWGWSADMGHDWNPAWVVSWEWPGPFGNVSHSSIAIGAAGGFDGTATLPALNIFGAGTIMSGFSLIIIPEPSVLALLVTGCVVWLVRKRRSAVRGCL